MKSFTRALLVGAAALQMAGYAQAAEFSGDVTFSLGGGDVQNNNGNDFTGDVEGEWTLGGRLGAQFENGIYGQLDGHYVEGDGYDPSPGSAGSSFEGHSLSGHLGYRTERYHFGGFYSYQYASEITSLSGIVEFDTWGIEAQRHYDRFSINAQAGYSDVRDNDIGEWHDVRYVSGDVSYFLNPDLSISGGVYYGHGQVESVDDAPLWHFNIEARKRFSGTPVSAFVGYEHGDFRNEGETPNDELTDDVLRAGFALLFGGATLQDQARRGASLSAPDQMLRYMGYSNQYD